MRVMPHVLTALPLIVGLSGTPTVAQEKIAEGEYAIQEVSESGAPIIKTATRWTLYRRKPGGYHLESEIQNLPQGLRLMQAEELDRALVPTSIGYELYEKEAKKPKLWVKCDFSNNYVTCGGQNEERKVMSSKRYRYDDNFWLWIEDLSALDMPWLLDGALNMSHATGKASVGTLTVSGGGAAALSARVNKAKIKAVTAPDTNVDAPDPGTETAWEFSFEKGDKLEFVGVEVIETDGQRVSARHYVLQEHDEPMHLWVAGPGILIKIDNVALINYKQYMKLIPEIRIEDQSSTRRAEAIQTKGCGL